MMVVLLPQGSTSMSTFLIPLTPKTASQWNSQRGQELNLPPLAILLFRCITWSMRAPHISLSWDKILWLKSFATSLIQFWPKQEYQLIRFCRLSVFLSNSCSKMATLYLLKLLTNSTPIVKLWRPKNITNSRLYLFKAVLNTKSIAAFSSIRTSSLSTKHSSFWETTPFS